MKKLLACVVALSAFSLPAFATSTRIANLAGMNLFIADDANIWIFPHMVERYTHMFELDYAQCDTATGACTPGPAELQPIQSTLGGGALLRLQEGLGLGVWTSDYQNLALNGALTALGGVGAGGQVGNLLADVDKNGTQESPNRKYDLFAAYRISDAIAVGAHFTYGSVNYTNTPDPKDRLPGLDTDRKRDLFSESDFRIDLGAGFDIDDSMGADVGFGYSRLGFSFVPNNDPAVGTVSNIGAPFSGGNAINLNGRFRAELSDYWDLYPAFSYSYFSINLAEDSTVPALPDSGQRTPLDPREEFLRKFTQQMFDLGAAARLRAAERVRFWVATGLQYQSTHSELDHTKEGEIDRLDTADMTQWTLPYVRLAIEAGLTEWLTFRGGAQKFVWDRTQKTLVDDRRDNANDRRATVKLDPVPTTGTPTFQSFAGVGIYWHGLAFDLMLDPMFFFRGPNFISGGAGALFQRVSLAYQF